MHAVCTVGHPRNKVSIYMYCNIASLDSYDGTEYCTVLIKCVLIMHVSREVQSVSLPIGHHDKVSLDLHMGTRLGPDKRGRTSSVDDDPVICLVTFGLLGGVGFMIINYVYALFNRNGLSVQSHCVVGCVLRCLENVIHEACWEGGGWSAA